MATVIYERAFEVEGIDARAVIVDHSQPDRLELHFGITERSRSGGPEVVTYRNQVQQACAQVSRTVRRAIWQDLFAEAKAELDREIRIATDPHHEFAEIERY
ncbi:MAG: hypothetical protein AB1451_06930 [Nitrospirota bacterium]